ncbi:GIY-YIG nuclease family protein [Patescibacteria group bacterium]|nr:GIY-YIG nuclease family protein [Patescibacteria group bacterium]MBU1035013.1 GIY-YIG nuclease family protein [Patescibacteria group bacterium]MBU1908190.1 GIY-YIG nuclease family protein [Patescibacteria group bacterium]
MKYEGIGVYILFCKNGRYYIGSTDEIGRRYVEHQKGYVKATKNLLPVSLVFFQKCDTLTDARSLENRLKKYKSRKIIEQIISDGYIKGV